MEFCHLVVGHVQSFIAALAKRTDELLDLLRIADLNTNEYVGTARVSVAVIKLCNTVIPDNRAELLEATGPLRNSHRQDSLPSLADLRSLGDMPQPIEVHVRPRGDRHQFRTPELLTLDVPLNSGKGEGTSRLQCQTLILEDILDRGTDFVIGDHHDLIDEIFRKSEGLPAWLAYGYSICEGPDMLEPNAPARCKRSRHRIGIFRLHTDDSNLRAQLFYVSPNPGNESTAANRNKDGVQVSCVLLQDLEADRALASDHVRIIVRMDKGEAPLLTEHHGMLVGLIITIPVQHNLSSETSHGIHFDVRRGPGHDDCGPALQMVCSQRHALGMVTGRYCNDALF